jgi:hypothetical protein
MTDPVWGYSYIIMVFSEFTDLLIKFIICRNYLRNDNRILDTEDVHLGEVKCGLSFFGSGMRFPGEGTIKTSFRRFLLIGAVIVPQTRLPIGEILWGQIYATIMLLADRRKHKQVIWSDK